MHRPRQSWLALAVALLMTSVAPSARAREVVTREVVNRAAVQETMASALVVARVQRYAALGDAGATDALVLELQQLQAEAALSGLARESLLDRGLHELTRVPPTAAGRSLLEDITRRSAAIFVRIDPDHGGQAAPLYDPAATARFVLRQWDRQDAARHTAAALAANQDWPIGRYARGELALELDPARAGVADAFSAADAGTLARYRPALAAALARGERVDELAAICADRLRDAELYRLLLGHADPAVALQAIARVPTSLDGDTAVDVLIAGSRREPIASASILAMGRIAAESARARAYLFTSLEDPATAPSAAAALASLHQADIAAELGRQLQSRKPDSARRARALALQLDGSDAARAQLEAFVKTRAGPAHLQKEVSTWLAQ
jgi:hypothetical protein